MQEPLPVLLFGSLAAHDSFPLTWFWCHALPKPAAQARYMQSKVPRDPRFQMFIFHPRPLKWSSLTWLIIKQLHRSPEYVRLPPKEKGKKKLVFSFTRDLMLCRKEEVLQGGTNTWLTLNDFFVFCFFGCWLTFGWTPGIFAHSLR